MHGAKFAKLKLKTVLADNPEFIDLLETENLPTVDLAGDRKIYFGLRDNRNNLGGWKYVA